MPELPSQESPQLTLEQISIWGTSFIAAWLEQSVQSNLAEGRLVESKIDLNDPQSFDPLLALISQQVYSGMVEITEALKMMLGAGVEQIPASNTLIATLLRHVEQKSE